MGERMMIDTDGQRATLSRHSRVAAFLCVALAACLCACETVVDGPQNCGPLATPTPAVVAAGSGALIVTDISGSMNGFALPGSARLFTLHDLIERAARGAVAGSESSPSLKRCYLGDALDCQSPLGLRDLDKASSYGARESRLDLFMRPAGKDEPAAGGGKAPAAADPVDPYMLAVLVTDGMQARTTGQGSATPCMAGADPDCMAHLLKQRVGQGYGVWMALLLLPFKGTHYPERPLDDSMWQKVQQHVAGLGQDSRFQGISFKVDRGGRAAPFESYRFEGVKPLMVLVLSKNVAAGRAFMAQFGETVKREGLAQPSAAVYTMELAPLSVTPRHVTRISIPPTAEARGAEPIIPGRRRPGLFEYQIACERNCAATLAVLTEERKGEGGAVPPPQVVPEGVALSFELVPAGKGGLPPSNLRIAGDGQEKGFELGLRGDQIKEGSYQTCLDLRASLRPDPKADAFWSALHADNMYESPERLFGLRDMVLPVLQAVTEKPRVTDRVSFLVERK